MDDQYDETALSEPRPRAPNHTHTVRDRLALGLGLAIGMAGAVLPAVATGFLLASVAAWHAVAEALQHSSGLVGPTFGGGFWTGTGVNAAAVLWSVIRHVRHRDRPDRRPWAPLAGLVCLYGIGLLLVPVDLTGTADVPDVLTTWALLGAFELWVFLVPPILVALIVQGLRWAWRHALGAPTAARRTAAIGASLGLAGAAISGSLVYANTVRYEAADVALAEPDLETAGVERLRRLMANTAAAMFSPEVGEPHIGRRPEDPFVDCIEALATARRESRPVVEVAKESLVRRGVAWHDAEDIALAALYRVCEKHPGARDRIQYYWRAVHNERIDHWKRERSEWRRRRRWAREPRFVDDDEPDPDDIAAVRAALETLSDGDRHVLLLRLADGLRHAEIARRLGTTETNARMRDSRALQRLKDAYRRIRR